MTANKLNKNKTKLVKLANHRARVKSTRPTNTHLVATFSSERGCEYYSDDGQNYHKDHNTYTLFSACFGLKQGENQKNKAQNLNLNQGKNKIRTRCQSKNIITYIQKRQALLRQENANNIFSCLFIMHRV